MPVERAKHLGVALDGSLNDRIIIGIARHDAGRLSFVQVHHLGDLREGSDVFPRSSPG
jgi:hypothetical protein